MPCLDEVHRLRGLVGVGRAWRQDPKSIGKPWENHGKIWLFNDLMGFTMVFSHGYLMICYGYLTITKYENHGCLTRIYYDLVGFMVI